MSFFKNTRITFFYKINSFRLKHSLYHFLLEEILFPSFFFKRYALGFNKLLKKANRSHLEGSSLFVYMVCSKILRGNKISFDLFITFASYVAQLVKYDYLCILLLVHPNTHSNKKTYCVYT